MLGYQPPSHYTGQANRFLLPASAQLWRIHKKQCSPTQFTAYRPNRRARSGRFDALATDPYGSYNAGLDAQALVTEYLLRGIPFSTKGWRTVRRVSVAGQRASVVATAAELALVSLCSAEDLAAVAQERWLIHADECHDFELRQRASWIRGQAGWADGFIWPARPAPDANRQLVVLFDDRCDEKVLCPDPLWHVDLDDAYGAAWLNFLLAPYRARIMPPRPSAKG